MHRLIFILFFILAQGIHAQSLEKRIPKETGFVLCFNLNSLSQKINFNDLGNYSFLKKPENAEAIDPSTAMKELFRLPEKGGINKKDKIYIYSENHDSINNLNYLIALSDAGLFQNRMIDILKTASKQPKFAKEGKLKILNHDHRMSIGVGKDYALVSIWSPVYYYADDYNQYSAERVKMESMIDSIRYSVVETDTAAAYNPEEELTDTVSTEEPEEGTGIAEVLYPSGYENDSLMKQFERKWVVKRKNDEVLFFGRQDKKMVQHQKKMSALKPAETMAVDAGFSKVFANTADVIYWFNYSNYSDQLIRAMSDNYSYRYKYDSLYYKNLLNNPPPNRLKELMDNNTMYGLGNFDKGELKMNFYNAFNDILKPYIEKMYASNINPEFFKYIKSDNLMGLIGMSINGEATANLYYEILRRAVESAAIPNQYYAAIIEMTDLFLDKNVLYHTFKGDAVLAFTGIKSYLKSYTSYEYDTLTFENRSVEKTQTNYIPEFVSILTIENKTNLQRILNMIKRLEGISEISKNVYMFRSRNKDIDSNFFFVLKDDLFFITNDKSLATAQILGDMSTERVVGDTYKDYLNSTSFGFWDASKMFRLMADGPEEKFGKPDMLQKLGDKINKGFFITRPLSGNVANYEITIEMKNRENSSLLEILKLFEDMYLLNKFKN